MYTKKHITHRNGDSWSFCLPPKESEEPDELQKVGDFISGPFILPFVIAIVTRRGGSCVFFSKRLAAWLERICRGVSFLKRTTLNEER